MADSRNISALTARQRTAQLLEPRREGDRLGNLIDLGLMILIISNVIAEMFATLPGYAEAWGDLLWHFEFVSVVIFSVEYVLRLWSCVELPAYKTHSTSAARLKWMTSPLGIIDLLAILPFYVFLLEPAQGHSALALRLFRGMRLLRIFKLARYSAALDVLRSVLKREANTLLMIAALLVVMLVLAAWGMYLLESKANPENFSSVPEALWWAVITLTTVGYGDVVPVTTGGRFFAGLISVIGIAIAALPAGVLAAGFASEVRHRENRYSRALKMALADGSITRHQAQELVKIREELGLSEQEAHDMFLDVKHSRPVKLKCPHCGETWHEGFGDRSEEQI